MVLVFGLVLATTAQPTNNAAEEKGKYSADCQSDGSILWHYRLWNFQGRGTKLERFLPKNQL